MRAGVFVTGTDTGIGKTVVSACLVRRWGADYWKPVQTGLATDTADSLTVAHLAEAAAGRTHAPRHVFQAPLSPQAAAAAEGATIALADFRLPGGAAPIVVEGAGGVLVPLGGGALMADLMVALGLPVLLVARHHAGHHQPHPALAGGAARPRPGGVRRGHGGAGRHGQRGGDRAPGPGGRAGQAGAVPGNDAGGGGRCRRRDAGLPAHTPGSGRPPAAGMMTDAEVVALYRCLLGRDPEAADTVAAFKAYYETLDRGRRAIFVSSEFSTVFARATGRVLDAGEHAAASLALALLTRASPLPAPSGPAPASDAALAAGMARFFAAEEKTRFAIVVGERRSLALQDLAPFGQPEAAVLHVTPSAPSGVPAVHTLPGGTTLFHLAATPADLAALLATMGRPIDALCLLGDPASAHWVDALRGHFAQRTLLVLGPAQDGFDPATLEAEIRSRHHCEPSLAWHGLTLLQVGGWMLPVTYAPPPARPAAPVRGAYPALAVASIVRDEAVCVRNMLASTQPVASFYAVLDTGSRDATPAIAQAFLETCGVPFAHAQRDHALFDDDFAAMRNAALAMVPDWIEWVLMLDADEELVAEDHTNLLALLAEAEAAADGQEGGVDAFALPRYNFPGADKSGGMIAYPDRQVRLLRHTPDHRVRYGGAVHETVQGTGHRSLPLDASALGLARGGPHIHHLVRRFRTPEEEERKQAFYREIAARRR